MQTTFEKLKDISHAYYIMCTQTFKVCNETCKGLMKSSWEIINTCEKMLEDPKLIELIRKKGELYNIAKIENYKIEDIDLIRLKHGSYYDEVIHKDDKTGKYFVFCDQVYRFILIRSDGEMKLIHREVLMNMTVIYLLTIFEAFNKDYFSELIANKPIIMTSQKTFTYKEILENKSIEDLHHTMAQGLVNNIIKENNIDEFNTKFLIKYFNTNLEEYKRWKSLREKYYRRNIIVHNNGFADEKYLHMIGGKNSLLRKKIQTTHIYVKRCFQDVYGYIKFIELKMKNKFNVPTHWDFNI